MKRKCWIYKNDRPVEEKMFFKITIPSIKINLLTIARWLTYDYHVYGRQAFKYSPAKIIKEMKSTIRHSGYGCFIYDSCDEGEFNYEAMDVRLRRVFLNHTRKLFPEIDIEQQN